MLAEKKAEQYEFFAGSLRDLIPDGHVLAKVARVLDLSWLRDEVAELYCLDNGRPGIEPEAAVRLMLAGFLLGIVHDRKLMREAAVNIAIRWFAGFGLTEPLPDHSSLTRIRQRWGEARFRRIFDRTVLACVSAGIAKGEVVHVDASLIRADVSWEALAKRWVDQVGETNGLADPAERDAKQSGKYKKVCSTDPEATMATSGRNQRLEPSYKQHTSVCDTAGVIVDVEVTTGELNEGGELAPALERVEQLTGAGVKTATADAGYAYAKVYGALERRGTVAIIPPKAEPVRSAVPLRRFSYDAKHDRLTCPRGRTLKPGRRVKHGRFFTSRARDCRRCDMAGLCLSASRVNKAVVVGDDYPALLRARRRREKWSEEDYALYTRHRWRVEGVHGESKTRHGLARAVRRGLSNMKIQAYLTAAAINLKRLAAAALRSWRVRLGDAARRLLAWVAIDPRLDRDLLTGLFNGPTRQRCQVAPRTCRIAAFRPSWASETTSFTPFSPRLLSERRKSIQNGAASESPTLRPMISRRPSVLAATAIITATETIRPPWRCFR